MQNINMSVAKYWWKIKQYQISNTSFSKYDIVRNLCQVANYTYIYFELKYINI